MNESPGQSKQNSNPYISESAKPKLRHSVVAFIDILGYLDMIQRDQTLKAQTKRLQDLHRILSHEHKIMDGEAPPDARIEAGKDYYHLRAFTDNIVIGFPINGTGEFELSSAIYHASRFQNALTARGYFVRGAVAVGPAYLDDIAVFGGALLEAYTGESRLARDPRIVLSKSAEAVAKQYLKDGRAGHSLLVDADGQWFINYLELLTHVDSRFDDPIYYGSMLEHKKSVESKLREFARNPPIWSKYAWAANYHNYFCDLHRDFIPKTYQIDMNVFRGSPATAFPSTQGTY